VPTSAIPRQSQPSQASNCQKMVKTAKNVPGIGLNLANNANSMPVTGLNLANNARNVPPWLCNIGARVWHESC